MSNLTSEDHDTGCDRGLGYCVAAPSRAVPNGKKRGRRQRLPQINATWPKPASGGFGPCDQRALIVPFGSTVVTATFWTSTSTAFSPSRLSSSVT